MAQRAETTVVRRTTFKISRALRLLVFRWSEWLLYDRVWLHTTPKKIGFCYYFYTDYKSADTLFWWWRISIHWQRPIPVQCLQLHTVASVSLHVGGTLHVYIGQSSMNNEASEPFKTDFTIWLILRLKRTGNKMLPWGTPVSCSYVSDRVELALIWNCWNPLHDFFSCMQQPYNV